MSKEDRNRRIFPRFPLKEDVDRELQAHLELCVDELVGAGWDPKAAREEAHHRFGDPRKVARACRTISGRHERAVRRGTIFEGMFQDLRYAVRGLLKSPGFALVAILTLALGIGANATVFSIVNGVLLKPLPYENPEELVWVAERTQGGGENWVTWPNFRDWREESRSLQSLAAFRSKNTTVLGGTEPAYTAIGAISRDFWSIFPIVPSGGRLTREEDHGEGAAPVAIVSESFAREVLAGQAWLGQVIEISGTRHEVVGIIPGTFDYPSGARVWTPLELIPQSESRISHNLHAVGRLHTGLTPEDAFMELDPMTRRIVAQTLADEGPDYLATGAVVRSLRKELVGDTSRLLYLLLGAAAFVLLVACTNLASTLLARGTTRAAEMAVRSAVGATRARIVRQLVLEASLLSILGSSVGLALTLLVLKAIQAMGLESLPRLDTVGIDGNVLLFTLGAMLATTVTFGLFPALRTMGDDQALVLRTEGRGQGGYKGKAWGALVATEVALALVLLTSSGLLIRSFSAILSEDGGFDGSDVAVASVAISRIKYPEVDDHRMFWDGILREAESLPGVSAAGFISNLPAGGLLPNGRIALNGDPTNFGNADYLVVSGGAFDALDVNLLQGRVFEERDGPDLPLVAVVSRSLADQYWPDEDPIGKLISPGGFWSSADTVFGTVVGVVSDVRFRALTRAGRPAAYWHYRQLPGRIIDGGRLVVESALGNPAMVSRGLRAAIGEADPDIPIRVAYLKDLIAGSLAERRFMLLTLSGFALIALFLASLGIYGVVSYAVARRTREMGIRLALGATREAVRRMVLKGAMIPVVTGLAAGVAGAWAISRILAGFLYEIEPNDPVTFLGVAALLLATALIASSIPARRGTKVDPMITMRSE